MGEGSEKVENNHSWCKTEKKVQDFDFFSHVMSYIFFLFRVIFGRELAVIYNNYLEERKNSAAWRGESCLATVFHARALNVKNKIW